MSDQITKDLGARLRSELAAVLRRQADIAAVVLTPDQVSLILLEAAVTIVRSVAASLAVMGPDAAAGEEIYDAVVAGISDKVAVGRAHALEHVGKEIAAEAS